MTDSAYATYYTYLFDVLLKTQPLLGEGQPYSIATKGETAYMTQEETNRSAFLVDFYTQSDAVKTMESTQDVLAFYFRLADGKTEDDLAKGTFRIESDKGPGSFLAQYYTPTALVNSYGIKIADTAENEFIYSTDSNNSVNVDLKYTGSDKQKLGSLSLGNVTGITVSMENQATKAPTVTAYDTEGDPMTAPQVTWSFNPSEAPAGVTYNAENGTITVTKDAQTGFVTVIASADGVTGSTTIQITRPDPEVSKVEIQPGYSDKLEIPADNAVVATNSTTFNVSVTDQFGTEISDPEVTWSLSETVSGVSIDPKNGTVTVTNEAKKKIDSTSGQEFTVTATCGDKSGTATLTVKRADSVATTVSVYGASSIEVPTSGSKTVDYNPTVTDQYGAVMHTQKVEWSVSENSWNITIDEDGILSVPYIAPQDEPASVTVTAKVNEASGSAQVSIVWDRSVANVEIVDEDGKENGSTDPNGYTIVIPAEGETILTLYARADDKYGTECPEYTVTWGGNVLSLAQADGKQVTITIPADAEPAEYTLTATVKDVEETTTVYVIDKIPLDVDMTGVSVTGADKTYDGTPVSQSGSATTEQGVEIVYTWETAAGETLAAAPSDVGSYKLVATVDDETYAGSNSISFTIEPKEVTVSNITALDKTYDGNTDATPVLSGASINGKLDEDEVTVASATGVFANKNVGTNKTVTISDITLGDTDAGNYTLAAEGNQATATASINAKKLTITGGTVTGKTYDGADAAAVTEVTFEGLVGSESLTINTDYTVTDAKFADANAGTKSVTATVTLISTGTAKNYTLASGSLSATGDIAKADITGFQTSAPTATVLANNEKNTGISALKELLNLPEKVTVTYGDNKTAELGITWADPEESFNIKGGAYTFKGTVEPGDNFNAYATTLDATVTVTAVNVTAIDGGKSITLSANQVNEADTLADLGVPESVTVTYDNEVSESTATAAWNTTLDQVKTAAGNVTEEQDANVTLTLDGSCLPKWATWTEDKLPQVIITITSKQPIPDTAISFDAITVTYGESYKPNATLTDTETYGEVTFTYTVDGNPVDGSTDLPTNAGTYQITATAENANYKGSKTVALTISQKPLANEMLDISGTYTYTGEAITPTYTVSDVVNEKELITEADYTVKITDTVNAGTATVTVTAAENGNYSGEISDNFTIAARPMTDEGFEVSGLPESMTYTGSEIKPLVNVTYNGKVLVQNTDYELNYANNTNAATADADPGAPTVTITGKGNFSDSITKTFTIAPAAAGTVTITGTNYEVGTELTASVSGMSATPSYQWFRNGEAIEGADDGKYTLADEDAGAQITVQATFTGNYVGVLTSAAIEVGKTPLTGTVKLTESGGTITATVTVTPDAENYDVVWLRDGVEVSRTPASSESNTYSYTTTAEDKGHTITVKLVAKGNTYTGEIVSSSGVAVAATEPGAPTVTATAGNGQVTVSWTVSDDGGAPVTQYKVQMGSESEIILDAATTSYTFTGLTNGTEYTFQVIAVNSVGDSTAGTDTAMPTAPTTPGGGGGGGVTRYEITVPSDVENGKITVSPTRAGQGSTVTITVTPDEGYELDSLTVTDADGNELTLTDKGDGKFTFTMPRGKVEIAASFKAVEEPQPSDFPFTDVTSGDWYYDAVVYAWENDLMTGTSATTFAPGMTTSRAMLTTLLYRLDGAPDLSDENLGYPYGDVDADSWYGDGVYWARLHGVVTGITSEIFNPNGDITREQMAAMLYRYAQYKGYDVTGSADLSGYADADSVSGWAEYAMQWAVDAGLISGVGNNTLNPQGSATRAEIATILMRFCQQFVQ